MQIELVSLTKRFGSLKALDQVSLRFEPGQVVAILGANAAGKTTLLRCLAAILAPDAGHIYYDSEKFDRGRIDLRKRLSFLPDFPIVFPRLTVARHIAMTLQLWGVDSRETAGTVTRHLGEFDLLHTIDTPVGQLSRGQIYKVALATMLTVNPELWMLDEPFASGMDPAGISYFKQQARLAASAGRTILYSTQILDIAERFSDRVCIIHRGKVRVFDAVANLKILAGTADTALEQVFQQLREEDR